MRHRYLRAQPVQHIQEHHRIEAAAYRYQYSISFEVEKLVFSDELADGVEHNREELTEQKYQPRERFARPGHYGAAFGVSPGRLPYL
ncbi:hypothetical protein GCM10022409_12500 [Hymenobacter glaciei]|uniref:Uncharacterized protein n=1 Tax=Hymenobacter glaciei TaxID=877209 RepID=A0ABP7TQU5_9BACT